jgi:hypothetical protein
MCFNQLKNKRIMKKISLFAIALMAVTTFTSCSKSRTCTCTTTVASNEPGYVAGPSTTTVNDLTKISKKDADHICVSTTDVETETGSVYNQTTTTTCTLK